MKKRGKNWLQEKMQFISFDYFFFFKCQAILYLNEFFKNIFLLKCKQALKFWGVGEGGVAMHFDAWGAMCEIKELLVYNPNDKISEISSSCSIILSCFPLKKKTDAENE